MRQFLAESFPDTKGCIFVEGKKFHYLSSVLRLAVGDMVYVRLPDGKLQNMTLAKIDDRKKKITLQIAGDSVEKSDVTDFHAAPVENSLSSEIWLFMFIAKPAKMDLVVRQAVECGVSKIIPVIGEFCQSGPVEAARKRKDDRIERIVTEARQQSGSATDTKICECMNVEQACNFWLNNGTENDENLAVVLYEQTAGTMSLFNAASKGKKIKRAAIAVGAEGGISPSEIELMQKAGFVPVHFETNILRCETAALYGIAAVQTVIQEAGLWQLKE